ncbi:thermonuclease family protein [Paenibacillus hamazuiensis]|uniref:thermonuclease family protein n=1 Tax=Paenibacillus hamazuiensis TaxID=2936508 RepID=UPI00200DCCF3|nr:thermonuclease family protein [Paenibacillus hamazuiensis]
MKKRIKKLWQKAASKVLNTALGLGVLFGGFAGTGYADSSASPSYDGEGVISAYAATASPLTIAQARRQGSGSATVRGEVVAVYPKSNAYIYDGTAGLRIYGNEAAGLALGSEIEITGSLTDYNGDLELKFPFTINQLTGNSYPTAQPLELPVNQVGEANEGQLVKVKNVWITGNYSSGDGGVNVTDGTGNLVVYALDQPGLKTYLQSLPTGQSNKFDIIGASSAFRNTIQIFPRGEADIAPAGSTGEQKTPVPSAARITFNNDNPAAASLTGQSGAVAASSIVNIYNNASRQVKVGTVTADAGGAFTLTFNNSASQYSSVYVTASAAGKTESDPVQVSAQTSGGEWYEVTVTSIADGDTFNFTPTLNVDGRSVSTVRMLNIDTPEVAQAPHGDQSTEVLKSMISNGTAVKLRLDQTKVDVYGRLLAHVFRKSDNLDVNKEMLRQGAAVNYYIYPNMLYFEEYGAAAKQAADEGKGIWNPANPLSKLPYEYRAAGCSERYVADYRTKKYYIPKRYKEIPFEYRVFFGSNKQEAKNAVYTPIDPADPSHNPQTDCTTGQLKTISELRANWNTEETYQVIGEVTAVHAPDHAFVQDATGGIHLYGKIPDNLAVGQEVRVDGNVQEFYGDLEFKNARIEVLTQDAIPTPQPQVLKLNQINEATEGSLIAVKNVWLTTNYDGGNGGVYMTDDTGARVVLYSPFQGGPFLDALQALPKGTQNKFDVIGNGSGWSNIREIYPRSLADIVPAQGSDQMTASPVAAKLTFNNDNAAAASVAGQSGAVVPSAAVKFYNNVSKQVTIGTVTADASGAFAFTFDNSASKYSSIYVSAKAAGKEESYLTQATAGGASGSTIAQARQQGSGSVTVRGEVVAVYPKSNAYIYDGTAGLRIYGNEAAGLTLGSEIEITGTLTDYNGDLELKYPFTINPLSGNNYPTPQPVELPLNQVGEANEGQLVKVKNVWITGNYSSGDGGVNVTDGTGTIVVYALDQPNLKTYLQSLPTGPSNKFDIVGASSVFRSTIQIFPRGQQDIAPAGQQNDKGSIKGMVKAEGRPVHSAIEVVAKHRGTGQETKVTTAADGSFAIQQLPGGSYTLSASLKHYFPVQMNVTVQAGQEADAGNLADSGNGGTADGMMRAGNTYAGDQEVNIYDAAIVGANIGKTTTEALSAADINGDGVVNQADMDLVKKNFFYKKAS